MSEQEYELEILSEYLDSEADTRVMEAEKELRKGKLVLGRIYDI